MKIIIAVDSFKGSCSASEAATYIEKGIKNVLEDAHIIKIPMADGGEGTLYSIIRGTTAKIVEREVTGPLGNKVKAKFGIIKGNIAIIEMAEASGLTLINELERNPLYTTSYGTGELILEAVKLGCKKIILGVGGSATNDGGIGVGKALGIAYLDAKGLEVDSVGGELKKIRKIDLKGINPLIKGVKIFIACDVKNPLYGIKRCSSLTVPG